MKKLLWCDEQNTMYCRNMKVTALCYREAWAQSGWSWMQGNPGRKPFSRCWSLKTYGKIHLPARVLMARFAYIRFLCSMSSQSPDQNLIETGKTWKLLPDLNKCKLTFHITFQCVDVQTWGSHTGKELHHYLQWKYRRKRLRITKCHISHIFINKTTMQYFILVCYIHLQ